MATRTVTESKYTRREYSGAIPQHLEAVTMREPRYIIDRSNPLVVRSFLGLGAAIIVVFLTFVVTGWTWLWTVEACLLGAILGLFMLMSNYGEGTDSDE